MDLGWARPAQYQWQKWPRPLLDGLSTEDEKNCGLQMSGCWSWRILSSAQDWLCSTHLGITSSFFSKIFSEVVPLIKWLYPDWQNLPISNFPDTNQSVKTGVRLPIASLTWTICSQSIQKHSNHLASINHKQFQYNYQQRSWDTVHLMFSSNLMLLMQSLWGQLILRFAEDVNYTFLLLKFLCAAIVFFKQYPIIAFLSLCKKGFSN